MKRMAALSLSLALALLLLAGCGRACNSENASSAEGSRLLRRQCCLLCCRQPFQRRRVQAMRPPEAKRSRPGW